MYSLYEIDDQRELDMTRIEEGRIGYYARFAAIMKTWNDEIIATWKLEIFVIDLPNFLSASRAIRKPHDSILSLPFSSSFSLLERFGINAEETRGKRNISSDVKISRETFSIPRRRNKKNVTPGKISRCWD